MLRVIGAMVVSVCAGDVDGLEVRDRKLLVRLERMCRFRVGEDNPLCD